MSNKFQFVLVVLVFLYQYNVYSQITIDGSITESQYSVVATKQNTNSGFGPNIDVNQILIFPDATNSILYLGIKGKLNTGSNDGLGVWINITGSGSPTGRAAGSTLGGGGGHHYIGDNGNPNYQADFEVDYMFAFNPGSGNSSVFFDAGKWVGNTKSMRYQGSCNQTGTSATNSNENGTVFAQNSITFAFNNSGGSNNGLEMSIPFAQLNANSSMSIQIFAFIVSNTAFFSDVTVPGNRTGGNIGFNPNFGALTGGPYHSSAQPLPVQLNSFNVTLQNNSVLLNWETATEINNYGFEIQRAEVKNQKLDWEKIGFVAGQGNSNSLQSYNFVDKNISNGRYSYRLKQIDQDGSFSYSPIQTIDVNIIPYNLEVKAFPNPFNPASTIQYSTPFNGNLTLKLFDLLGKEVYTLVDEYKNPGTYQVKLDGSNLSNGIYLLKLQSGNYNKFEKVILLK